MPRIAVFGGSFNPPTLAHEAIIRRCLELPQFDEVWVLPSGSRADKAIPTNDQHRLEMLHAMHSASFADDPRLVISDFELRLPRPTETRRTIRELAVVYPDAEFWFVYGNDSYRDMPNWPGAAEFMDDIRALVFGEAAYLPAASDRLCPLPLPAEMSDVSSTAIRAAAVRGGGVGAWVSPAVASYIEQNALYHSPAIL